MTIKEHPIWFFLAFLLEVVMSLLHSSYAIEYARKHKRPFLEGLAMFLFMMIAWPLFSFGMMCRGYAHFCKNNFGKTEP